MTDYSRWILGTSACLTLWWFGFTPQWLVIKIWRSIAAVLGIFLGPVVALLRGSPDEEELLTLKASMRNVTRDYDQLATIVQEYFTVRDPASEQRFRDFLAAKAARSHAGLELVLDWLLTAFKILTPFLIFLIAVKSFSSQAANTSSERPVPSQRLTRAALTAASEQDMTSEQFTKAPAVSGQQVHHLRAQGGVRKPVRSLSKSNLSAG
eukprot:jgi/Astpho2/350/Aster-02227